MSVHSEWLEKLKVFKAEALKATGKELHLPPPSNAELQIEYLEIEPGKRMVGRIPFQSKFTNPAGTFQGGFLGAGLDEVFGPLSYITSGVACMTLSLNLTFLKAFTSNMSHVVISAEVLKKTNNFIFMRGEVRSPDGDIICIGESHVSIPAPKK